MSSPFDRPAPPGDQFSCETHVGALLVMDVLEHVPPMQTKVSDKPQDAIRANVYVISPQGTVAEQFLNTLLFPRMLVSRLRQSIGRKVLGVLTGEPNVKRDGKNVPYDLADPTDPMEQAAIRAMSAHAAQQMQSAPPAQQWGQPATQPPAPGWGGSQDQAPPGWGRQSPAPAQQGPPPGWGQQPAAAPAAGPWGQPPVQPSPGGQPPAGWGATATPGAGAPPAERYGQQQIPQQPAAGPWGQPTQQERPPWEQEQQQAAPPWGGQQ